jgi:predicted DNA-binding antitoxin AbrB/MazE fold protein
METIHAIYENGIFRPTSPVALPDHCQVEFEPRLVDSEPRLIVSAEDLASIHQILSRSYETGQPDLAARHNEHQP